MEKSALVWLKPWLFYFKRGTGDIILKIKELFKSFDKVLGPVGAAKSLHLFASRFFPLWDSAIAERYGLPLAYGKNNEKHDLNAKLYHKFMKITLQQYILLAKEQTDIGQLLKLLDEYNYVLITKEVDLEKWKQPI